MVTKHKVEKLKMEQSLTDPCVIYKKWNNTTELMTGMNVDDAFLLANEERANWFVKEISKRFTITVHKTVKKHLGVDHEWRTDGKRPYIDESMKDYQDDIWQSYEKSRRRA